MTQTVTASPEIVDVLVENHGSIFLFRPVTTAGTVWLTEHTDGQWFAGALVVEHRYARDLADGLTQEGLVVQ